MIKKRTILSKQWRFKSSNSFWRPISKNGNRSKRNNLGRHEVAWRLFELQSLGYIFAHSSEYVHEKLQRLGNHFERINGKLPELPIFVSNLHGQVVKKGFVRRLETLGLSFGFYLWLNCEKTFENPGKSHKFVSSGGQWNVERNGQKLWSDNRSCERMTTRIQVSSMLLN